VTGATLPHRVQLRDDPIAGHLGAPDAIRLTRDYRRLNTSIYQQTWALLVQLIRIEATCCSAVITGTKRIVGRLIASEALPRPPRRDCCS
jgi:hypothetical protein